MQVVRMSEAPAEPFENRLFTSNDVKRRDLATGSKDYAASEVLFGRGVRNKFHIHESDQLLIVTSGRGELVEPQRLVLRQAQDERIKSW